jgi:predicted amidophosphoribosyltransferase
MSLEWKSGVLNLLFPPLCIACREPSGSPGFCAGCWSTIQFLDGSLCQCCGIPFDVPLTETSCAACLTRPPAFDKARAILRYDDVSRAPILALKHADRLDLVPGFGVWLERAGRELIAASDLVVPLPLHRGRLWRRRYNQAAELARAGAVLSWPQNKPRTQIKPLGSEDHEQNHSGDHQHDGAPTAHCAFGIGI